MKKIFTTITLLATLFTAFSLHAQTLKFGIIADIHPDIMFDGDQRLTEFLNASKKNRVDFIIELGDFCQAKESNRDFVKIWDSYKGEKHHVIGNHDLDATDKTAYMEFVGMKSRYYSFDKENFHFIILDLNNILVDGVYKSPFRSGRYGNQIDPTQLEWLKKDLASTDKKCIVFSHQSLERPDVIENATLVRDLFEKENKKAGYSKIIAAISGHDHTDYQKIINGIAYIQINSASNQWVGQKYKCESRFNDSINKEHPYIKCTAPYKDALYAMVKLTNHKLVIKGKKSEFISPTPGDLNMPDSISGTPLVPYISDFKFKFK